MKKMIPSLLFLLSSWSALATDVYVDRPLSIAEGDRDKLFSVYLKKAKRTRRYFNREFEKGTDELFYIVTRLYNETMYEQVFVLVSSRDKNMFTGVIASDLVGQFGVERGSTIEVENKYIYDWVIWHPDGREEGNFLGKTIDLVDSGVVVFFQKSKKEHITFRTIRVVNPVTRQDVTDIFSNKALRTMKRQLTMRGDQSLQTGAPGDGLYVTARFPSLEIIRD